MQNEVSWLLELSIARTDVASFRSLMEEMVESTRGETGTLSYAWYISEDQSDIKILERYRDSDAVMAHMATFGEKFADRFMSMVTPTMFTIMGTPSEAVKAIFEQFSPTYHAPFGGFVR